MVFLHQSSSSSRKPTTTTTKPSPEPTQLPQPSSELTMISILADAGCTVLNPNSPPSLPSDPHTLRRRLHHLFSSSDPPNSFLSDFVSGFDSYIRNPRNLRRLLLPCPPLTDSLVRILLLIPSLQLHLQLLLLEKLPDYFNYRDGDGDSDSMSFEDDVGRLIVAQFRWLNFLVDSEAFVGKLLEVVSICPKDLKKEIIGSIPEMIGGDEMNNGVVVGALRELMKEDSEVIVPVLDSISNLSLDEELGEQVVTMAIDCIRTIDLENMPYLIRFLMLSATPVNGRRIISQIREQLKFVGVVDCQTARCKKLKGKSSEENSEGLVLEALRSSLQFKNNLCQEILKELKSLDKAQDHKVVDVWLLILIYTNGGSLQKVVEKILKKKIMDGHLREALFDQCIHGHREIVHEYFSSFLSVCEYLLACKEQKSRDFSVHLYTSLFDEFNDLYSRQEILGALVTHVGSGISYEVSSALDAMVLLASKNSDKLLPLCSHINGILDYLEGFNLENLHKVYEVFSLLSLSARSNAESIGSSIANELLMIVRKQVSNPDLKYKRMGVVGALKIVSCLGNTNNANSQASSQKKNCEESVELLKISLDSCKLLPLPSILFYDDLITLLERTSIHPTIMEWIGKHVGDFESMFLSDLEGGKLLSEDSYCGIEGQLWMNLDGDLSPICLNMLPLVSSSSLSLTSLQVLPAYFRLLSVVERLTNQGSLGGIDALLGCPLYLPSPKYFVGAGWLSLTGKQKQVICQSLYYAANWIRELLNAFCTQVSGRVDCVSQATKEEIIAKLLKRLRNLILLESLLNTSLKLYPISLPELNFFIEHSRSSHFSKANNGHMEKKHERKMQPEINSSSKKHKSSASQGASSTDKLKQPTIFDVLKKAGAVSQEVPNGGSSSISHKEKASQTSKHDRHASNDTEIVEISAPASVLDAQRFKCRPLLIDCFSIFIFSEIQKSCCSDPAAKLPLHLYLLHDLSHKLSYLSPQSKPFPAECLRMPSGLSMMTTSEFLSKIRQFFPSLKKQLDSAVNILKEGDETCEDHWQTQSALAGNPDIPKFVMSKSSVAVSVSREVLSCFSKILKITHIQMDISILSALLEAFQLIHTPDGLLSKIQPIPSPGNIDYLYLGAYSFLEGVLEIASSFSVLLASDVLSTLESVVISARSFLELFNGNEKSIQVECVQKVLPLLCNRLGICAQKLLMHNFDGEEHDNNGSKSKGETIQNILRIYIENSESTADLLEELACSILPQVPSSKPKFTEEAVHGYPTLCPITFVVWCRVLEMLTEGAFLCSMKKNLVLLNKLVKEAAMLGRSKARIQLEPVHGLLIKLRQSINVVVSLVNMCKTHDKVQVHALAVKHGGKFVDSFIKVFDFLQAHFQAHGEVIIQLVKELQKATRTIQTLCCEAKDSKRLAITTKIPATKRSMERFLFRVKALLHNSSTGCTFWMGNLKHKDLLGQVVSSQVYADGYEDVDEAQDVDMNNNNDANEQALSNDDQEEVEVA